MFGPGGELRLVGPGRHVRQPGDVGHGPGQPGGDGDPAYSLLHPGVDPRIAVQVLRGAANGLVQPAQGLRQVAAGEGDQPEPACTDGDPMEQLTKLAALRDQGVLTDEEFATQKAKLLAQM